MNCVFTKGDNDECFHFIGQPAASWKHESVGVIMDRYFEIKQRLWNLAETNDGLLAVVAFGSSAREYAGKDAYSDLDLILVCRDPGDWLYGNLPETLGEIKLSFVEPTFADGMERRILYDGSLDVDLILLTPEQMEQAVNSGVAAEVLGRGYTVLYDAIKIGDRLKHIHAPAPRRGMTEQEFLNTVNDFWFHTVWSAKKILRGELWTAKMCIDAYMKNLLLKMLEESEADTKDVWHNGRFLEKWAGDDVVAALDGCFAHYDRADMVLSLTNTARLFGRMARRAAQIRGFSYPDEAEKYACSLLDTYLGET